MYISNNVAERIKELSKEKGISLKKVLETAGLSFNTMAHMKTSMPKADNLAKIADCLNVSVDYLLGRTDDPVLHKKAVTFTVEDEPLYVVKFAGRNGKFTEEYMTAEQIEELKKKIDSLPEADF